MMQRRHVRFKDPQRGAVQLSWGQHTEIYEALIYDESLKGMSCIVVSDDMPNEESIIIWHEAENVKTMCRLVRVKELMEGTFFVALELIQ